MASSVRRTTSPRSELLEGQRADGGFLVQCERRNDIVHGGDRTRGVVRERAFTLLELLTVLTIVAVLMGIGVGAFSRLQMGRSLAVAQVKDALRAARLFAIEQSSQSRVDMDPGQNVIQASGFIRVGNWHFEDDVSKGWPSTADFRGGASLIQDGAVGHGIRFAEDDVGWVDLGKSPSFDADVGLKIEAFVRLGKGFSGGSVLSKGKAFELALTESGNVVAAVRVRPGEVAEGDREGLLHLETSDQVPKGRWSRIGLLYDGLSLRIFIDGRERSRLENAERLVPWPAPADALAVGSLTQPIAADIDEVHLSSIVIHDAPPLPEGVAFKETGTVWFDGRGRLDPERHQKPVRITLVYDENRRTRSVEVGLLGEIR